MPLPVLESLTDSPDHCLAQVAATNPELSERLFGVTGDGGEDRRPVPFGQSAQPIVERGAR
ncbi:hypothetical protein [Streptomyces sp. NPDC055992]|uniref:hypothetical protein n=1 Tax=Streptomyces sp. NPDC055992 TaxID=3345673 RepID=UPI0035E34B43